MDIITASDRLAHSVSRVVANTPSILHLPDSPLSHMDSAECSPPAKAVFPLFALPAEIRLEIYNYLLAPERDGSVWHDETSSALTNLSTLDACSRFKDRFYAPAHELEEEACQCTERGFRIIGREQLCPAILRVSRTLNSEALPSLYRDRVFSLRTSHCYRSLHDAVTDRWWLLEQWLRSLSEATRRHIRHVQLPHLYHTASVYGCRHAYCGIAAKLPNLQHLRLEIWPSSRFVYPTKESSHVHVYNRGLWLRNLGPVMAFATADTRPVAVNKHDIPPAWFAGAKTEIEEHVMGVLLPMQRKHMERERQMTLTAVGIAEDAFADSFRRWASEQN